MKMSLWSVKIQTEESCPLQEFSWNVFTHGCKPFPRLVELRLTGATVVEAGAQMWPLTLRRLRGQVRPGTSAREAEAETTPWKCFQLDFPRPTLPLLLLCPCLPELIISCFGAVFQSHESCDFLSQRPNIQDPCQSHSVHLELGCGVQNGGALQVCGWVNEWITESGVGKDLDLVGGSHMWQGIRIFWGIFFLIARLHFPILGLFCSMFYESFHVSTCGLLFNKPLYQNITYEPERALFIDEQFHELSQSKHPHVTTTRLRNRRLPPPQKPLLSPFQ